MSDKVSFFINETDFSDYLKRFTVNWDIFGGPGQLNVEVGPVTKENENAMLFDSWSKETKFLFKINDIGMMRGYVDTINISRSKNMSSVQITGRDMMASLTDNYIMKSTSYPPPNESVDSKGNILKYYSIKNIIKNVIAGNTSVDALYGIGETGNFVEKKIIGSFGLPAFDIFYNQTAENILKTGPAVTRIRANYGQTLFDFISSLLNQRGIFLYAVPGESDICAFGLDPAALTSYDNFGNPETIGTERFVNFRTNTEENNILESRIAVDLKEFYKLVRAVGQAGQEETLVAPSGQINVMKVLGNKMSNLMLDIVDGLDVSYGSSKSATMEDIKKGFNGQTKFRSTDIRNVDGLTWTKAGHSIQDNIQFRQYRGLLNVSVKTPTLTSGGRPYFMNRVYGYADDFISANMYCFGLQMSGSKEGGMETVLNLAFPWKTFFDVVPFQSTH